MLEREGKMQADKIIHIMSGFIIGVLTGTAIAEKTGSYLLMLLTAFLSGIIAGVLKELYDKYVKKNTFDTADLICTILGSATSLTWLFIYVTIIRL